MQRLRLWGMVAVPALAIVLTAALAYTQMPVPEDLKYTQTKDQTPVTFSHKKHQAKNPECTACHVQIFQMKKGATTEGKPIMVADLLAGKYCGACHNGQKAFPITDCVKCHPAKK